MRSARIVRRICRAVANVWRLRGNCRQSSDYFCGRTYGKWIAETGASGRIIQLQMLLGATLIIVTHDADLPRNAIITLIKDGKIMGSNIPKEGKSGR